jgi:hypothetical protein
MRFFPTAPTVTKEKRSFSNGTRLETGSNLILHKKRHKFYLPVSRGESEPLVKRLFIALRHPSLQLKQRDSKDIFLK